jgi:hypothetical protein
MTATIAETLPGAPCPGGGRPARTGRCSATRGAPRGRSMSWMPEWPGLVSRAKSPGMSGDFRGPSASPVSDVRGATTGERPRWGCREPPAAPISGRAPNRLGWRVRRKLRLLRGPFPADLTIERVGKQLCGFLLVRSDHPKVIQSLGKGRVLVEHARAVMALPPTLVRLDRSEEPRHQAIVGTQGHATKCRRSRLGTPDSGGHRHTSRVEGSRLRGTSRGGEGRPAACGPCRAAPLIPLGVSRNPRTCDLLIWLGLAPGSDVPGCGPNTRGALRRPGAVPTSSRGVHGSPLRRIRCPTHSPVAGRRARGPFGSGAFAAAGLVCAA